MGSAAAAVLLAATSVSAYAAPGETSSDTTVANVGVVGAISLTGLTPEFKLNGLPGATVTEKGAVSLNVSTNNIGGYVVSVQSEDKVLRPRNPDNPDYIPIDALQVSESGLGEFTRMSPEPIIVHKQGSRSAERGDDLSNDYQVDIPFVAEDTYSVTLNYIATTI